MNSSEIIQILQNLTTSEDAIKITLLRIVEHFSKGTFSSFSLLIGIDITEKERYRVLCCCIDLFSRIEHQEVCLYCIAAITKLLSLCMSLVWLLM